MRWQTDEWRWRRDAREWLVRPRWPARHAAGERVIVDNGSTDGSREVLEELHAAGLIRLIANERQRFHGPALNQGISWLARNDPVDYVWVLDSDVVVLRGEVVADAVRAMKATRAAMLGEHDGPKVALNSVLLDPAAVWRRSLPPFLDHGDPSIAMQRALGERVGTFPFRHGTYVLHLGRGTLAGVADAGETGHPQFEWARAHRERTYGSHPFGERLHRAFLDVYAEELDGSTLAQACARPDRIVFPTATPLPPLEEVARRWQDGTLDELYGR